jgi:hypothetical protein
MGTILEEYDTIEQAVWNNIPICLHSIIVMTNETKLIGQCQKCNHQLQMAKTIVAGRSFFFNPYPVDPRFMQRTP